MTGKMSGGFNLRCHTSVTKNGQKSRICWAWPAAVGLTASTAGWVSSSVYAVAQLGAEEWEVPR
eukprot:COSAG02_NODE_4157_length_5696_cov_6.012328_3_plen_64_part_00